ncbi:DUF4421 domain-containing protein [Pseudoflavitalea sp. X16]|uniref:DUF4421 domain-containing protein n=1 Tax=Paraflavitalea devenefica TaxID=2716334 RepID=UPI00141F662B|nr:DUF4421 domain-containing protein [Paraflavitalea devenefica]NII24382.1 DUF4421 domain-containing protein [Paraflavitalea devenefica]
MEQPASHFAAGSPRKAEQVAFIVFVCFFFSLKGFAQTDSSNKFDRDYYESYTDLITSRLYFSQKYTSLRIRGSERVRDLQYRPNTTLNFGVGATYGWFTLNLAYGFDFLNRADETKGKTRYLDLQSHIYTRKMSIDLFGQFYKGFYGYPKKMAPQQEDQWYLRPDIRMRHFGAAGYYIYNWKKFSLRSAMLQNEWQKRSAGTLLIGGEFYYGQTKGDSALVPSAVADNYKQAGVTRIRYFDIGPGVGYAYTAVLEQHFFATGSLTMSLPLSFQKQWRDGIKESRLSVSPDLLTRIGIGYNSDRSTFSIMWVNSTVQTKGKQGEYAIQTGNVRLNAAYRFEPGPKLKRTIKIFDVAQ